ncbi:hypothetical protein ACFOW4_28880 [Micromonospora sp. GCM10011542]|uniref:hypothetical protein n=1 Tax=Micromonospora sp. GCM10011542 TaxID=3317337 RepID=UPI0036191B14
MRRLLRTAGALLRRATSPDRAGFRTTALLLAAADPTRAAGERAWLADAVVGSDVSAAGGAL